MKILLINPEPEYKYSDFPLGLLYLATYLEKNNGAVIRVFDKNQKFLKKELNNFKPELIGIFIDAINFSKLNLYLKNIPNNIEVIVGGPGTLVYKNILIKNKKISKIIIGEGELILSEYLKEKNKKKFKKKILQTKEFINLKNTPLPDFKYINIKKYSKKWLYFSYKENIRGVSLITSRGCPFNCKFCQPTLDKMFGKKIRRHKVEDVVQKIQELKVKYQINSIFFHDDVFTMNKKWLTEFCNAIINKSLKIYWGCNSRVDSINEDTVKLMKRAGCIEVRLGIESFNQKSLNYFNKNIKIKQIHSAINILKKYKINSFAFLIIGSPHENIKDILKILFKATNSNLDDIRISILTILPETYLFYEEHQKLKKPKNYNYIKNSKNNISKIPYFTLSLLRKFGYLIFYFHPKRIKRTLKSLNSIKKIISKLERF